MTGRPLVGGLAALLLLFGCAAPTPPAVEQAPRTPLPAPTVALPTTAAPEPGVDVVSSAIRSAPAACGAPEHQLVGHRGRVGDTRTLLQVDERHRWNDRVVAPVDVDLTGDGGMDLVGVLSCTVADQERSDSLVLYTGPATPAAALDLGAGQGETIAVARSLTTVGGEVRVEWTAFAGAGRPAGQYEASVVWNGRELVLEDVASSSGPRTISVENASFMSPDGNVHCVLHGALGWCDVSETTWTPPSPPPPTPTAEPTATPTAAENEAVENEAAEDEAATQCAERDYGRTFLLNAGRASQTCTGEQGPEIAALGAPLAGWHREGWDPVVVVNDRRSAALGAGSIIRTQAIECEASASEVTCTDTRTQATFTVGRSTSRLSTG